MVLITAANDIVKNNLNLELILKQLRMHLTFTHSS